MTCIKSKQDNHNITKFPLRHRPLNRSVKEYSLAELGDPKPVLVLVLVLADPNGFLLAASWLGLPPRPLKKPPPVLLLLVPKRPPLVADACKKQK